MERINYGNIAINDSYYYGLYKDCNENSDNHSLNKREDSYEAKFDMKVSSNDCLQNLNLTSFPHQSENFLDSSFEAKSLL